MFVILDLNNLILIYYTMYFQDYYTLHPEAGGRNGGQHPKGFLRLTYFASRGWRSASERFYVIFKFIFVILDPNNIYFDVLHHVLFRLIYLAFRGWRSKCRLASKRL
jgi:hypothetical protein